LWDDPDRFDPENFAPGRARHRYAYIPFGAGPRICIGQGLAMMEAQIILASVLARFRLRPVPGAMPVPEMIMTVRPRGGIRLRVEPRDAPLPRTARKAA
jgi:cytochrome P450